MKRWITITALWGIVLGVGFGLAAPWAAAKDSGVTVAVQGGSARVSFLQGQAWVQKEERGPEAPVAQGGQVSTGQRVRTGAGARLELQLPDGSFLRFDENTSFSVIAAAVEKEKDTRDIRIKMLLGKTWAKVSRLFMGRGRFDIQTPTAVAGVRGTVYRMNLESDNSAMVKVYEGEVEVKRQLEDQAAAPPGKFVAPRPVAGPHPVTMEEWVYIVRSLQQINIAPDGTATKPFRFDIKADLNEWVRWNQLRDEQIQKSSGNPQ